MHTTPVYVDTCSFDQKKKFSKVNKAGVRSSQVSWLQSPGQEKKKKHNKKSPVECLALCHIPLPPGLQDKRGERRKATFLNVHLSTVMLLCDSWQCQCVKTSGVTVEGLSFSNLLWEQMWAFDLDSSRAFSESPLAGWCVCTEGPGQGQSLKLKPLLNRQLISFHNMRGLRKKGVRLSKQDDWTGMSSSLWWILMSLFSKLNICCDDLILATVGFACRYIMCLCLLSPCWFLIIIYIAGYSK